MLGSDVTRTEDAAVGGPVIHDASCAHVVGCLFQSGAHYLGVSREHEVATPGAGMAAIDIKTAFTGTGVVDHDHMHGRIKNRGHAAACDGFEQVVSHTELGGAELALLVPLVEFDGEGIVPGNCRGGSVFDCLEVELVGGISFELTKVHYGGLIECAGGPSNLHGGLP